VVVKEVGHAWETSGVAQDWGICIRTEKKKGSGVGDQGAKGRWREMVPDPMTPTDRERGGRPDKL